MSLADEPFSLLAMLIVDEKQLLKDFRHFFFQLAFDWNWFHSVEVKEKRKKAPNHWFQADVAPSNQAIFEFLRN